METSKVVKAGWKTSEFWATAVASMVPLLNEAMGWNLPVEAMVALAGSIAAYVLPRGMAKK